MSENSKDSIVIRAMKKEDSKDFADAFAAQNWHKPMELFESYYNQQQRKERAVVIAEINHEVAGYVTLIPNAVAGPYASQNIPEIVDLNVLIKFQENGIGKRMMDRIESIAREKSDSVSIGVGLHSGYGPAQRMYVKRGYIPDGSGVWYQDKQLGLDIKHVNVDDLVLYFLKKFV